MLQLLRGCLLLAVSAAALIPREKLFSDPKLAATSLSPDGKVCHAIRLCFPSFVYVVIARYIEYTIKYIVSKTKFSKPLFLFSSNFAYLVD